MRHAGENAVNSCYYLVKLQWTQFNIARERVYANSAEYDKRVTPVQLLLMLSLTSPGFMDKLASVQPGFWYKNRVGFDTKCKYWLLQDGFTAAWGWRGADLPCSQAFSPHLLWLAALFTPTPVGNVSMGHRQGQRCTGLIGAHIHSTYIYTHQHTLFSVSSLAQSFWESDRGCFLGEN